MAKKHHIAHIAAQEWRQRMNKIVEILMRRDGISELEATNIVEDCREEVLTAIGRGNFQEAEDIVASELGLEPDYLDYLIW